jgi:acetyltransferase-like isoleucine patch superfamily enzyme
VSVRIEDDVFIGPGAIILPNVTIGHGAVVHAGSVVTRSVPPLTMVRGNPAEPVARCGVPLGRSTPLRQFYRQLQPL